MITGISLEFKQFLNTYLYQKVENTALSETQKCLLVFEMQKDIEISMQDAFIKANKLINGDISKYGILI